MSKIAEKKALEAYPEKYDNLLDTNVDRRIGYRQGYEQAMQDFEEYLKYCSTFTDMNGNTRIDNNLLNTLIDNFKNYMEEQQ